MKPPLPSLAVTDLFGPGGPLAASHPRYEPRAAQADMAGAVERVFQEGGHLVVEAGTGTGKTLAYLLPAVRSGRRVVISTATKALQEQLIQKDIPFLREAFGVRAEAAVMKGRANYLCLHRFREFCRKPVFERREEITLFPSVRAWAGKTETGDLAELPDLPEDTAFWQEINARADTCLGRKCEDFDPCWLTRMKERAASADLVIVNHHLLLADLVLRESSYGSILPEYDALVLDEAHRIEEVATHSFGITVSTWRLRELVGDAGRAVKLAGARVKGLTKLLSEIETQGMLLFSVVAGRTGRSRLDERGLGEEGLGRLEEEGQTLSNILAVLGQSLRGAGMSDDLEAVARRADEIARDLLGIVTRAEPGRVFWYEERPGGVVLHSSPTDVSDLLRGLLFESLHACVLTSATLAVGGTTDFFRGRVGLPDAEEMVLPSPFDWPRQALLYAPGDLPEPRNPGFADACAGRMIGLCERSRGRAFLLFTSFQNLRAVEERVRSARLPYPLLVQGEAPKHALLERFQKEGNAVLLATASFWEGVDVPGEALSLVVVDKLPFAVPTDPVVAARCEEIEAKGGSPFTGYLVPEAILDLKQGLGRLIRSREDRGVLAVLDSRLVRQAYGRLFLASLPPCRRTSSLEEVAHFFA